MLGRIPKNGCPAREFSKQKSQARRYAFIMAKHDSQLILLRHTPKHTILTS